MAAFAKRILSTRLIPSFRQIIMCLSSLILVPLWITDWASHCDWAGEKNIKRNYGKELFWNKILIFLNVNAIKRCFQLFPMIYQGSPPSFFSSLCTIINLLKAFLFYSHKFSTGSNQKKKKNLMQIIFKFDINSSKKKKRKKIPIFRLHPAISFYRFLISRTPNPKKFTKQKKKHTHKTPPFIHKPYPRYRPRKPPRDT